MPVLFLACHLPHNTPNIPSRYNNEQTTKQTKAINNSYIYISHVNVTQTVPDISPLMPMHQDPLLVCIFVVNGSHLHKIQRSLERGTKGISHFIWNGATFQPEAKMTKWILNCIFPCDGVEYWYQDWLWWLGSIHRVWICVCQFN